MTYLDQHDGTKFLALDSFPSLKDSVLLVFPFDEPKLLRIRNGNLSKLFMIGRGKNTLEWNLTRNEFRFESEEDADRTFRLFETTISDKYVQKSIAISQQTVADTPSAAATKKMWQYMNDSLFAEVKAFIREHHRSFYSLDLVRHYSSKWRYSDTKEAYASLADELKTLPTAKRIANYLATKRDRFELDGLVYINTLAARPTNPTYYLVDFWGTWCKPCVAEIPRLKKLQAAHKGRLQTIGIAYEAATSPLDFKAFIKRKGIDWPQVLLKQGRVEDDETIRAYSVMAFPTYFLLDADGKILFSDAGERGLNQIENFLSTGKW